MEKLKGEQLSPELCRIRDEQLWRRVRSWALIIFCLFFLSSLLSADEVDRLLEEVRPPSQFADHASFAFADWAYLRIGKDKVEVSGYPRALKVRVKGHPKLVINGEGRSPTVKDGLLTFIN